MWCLSVLPSRNTHDDERLAVAFVNFVDSSDVRMIQGGACFGFTLETTEGLRIFGDIIGQELQGDKAAQFDVFGLVDDTHPPTAEPLDEG